MARKTKALNISFKLHKVKEGIILTKKLLGVIKNER